MATKIQPPYLADIGTDGKKIYTPREWTERFQHYIKRIHKIDIKHILTDDTVPTDENWNTKEPEIIQDFIWGAGPSAIETITKGEFNTDPDTIEIEKIITAIPGMLHAKKKYLPLPWKFRLGKARIQRDTRRTLGKTNNTGKEL